MYRCYQNGKLRNATTTVENYVDMKVEYYDHSISLDYHPLTIICMEWF